MKAVVLSIAGLLVGACLTCGAKAETTDVLNYGCKDIVVVGRVQNLRHVHVDLPGDIIGHGWNLAQVKAEKVLVGKTRTHDVSIQYFGHTFMREDRDFLLDLMPVGGDVFEIRDARLLEGNQLPSLAARCGSMSY